MLVSLESLTLLHFRGYLASQGTFWKKVPTEIKHLSHKGAFFGEVPSICRYFIQKGSLFSKGTHKKKVPLASRIDRIIIFAISPSSEEYMRYLQKRRCSLVEV